MPDICMCNYKECPLKDKCYRYTATPWKLGQTCFSDHPYKIVETKEGKKYFTCDMFWGQGAENIYNKLVEITTGLDNLRGA